MIGRDCLQRRTPSQSPGSRSQQKLVPRPLPPFPPCMPGMRSMGTSVVATLPCTSACACPLCAPCARKQKPPPPPFPLHIPAPVHRSQTERSALACGTQTRVLIGVLWGTHYGTHTRVLTGVLRGTRLRYSHKGTHWGTVRFACRMLHRPGSSAFVFRVQSECCQSQMVDRS